MKSAMQQMIKSELKFENLYIWDDVCRNSQEIGYFTGWFVFFCGHCV